jgi:predicted DNA-binding protein with PD1-like motif
MFVHEHENKIFIRLDPGERIIEALIQVAKERHIETASIDSGVGMVSGVEFGFFCVPKDDYDKWLCEGIHDLSSIQGNITMFNGAPRPHVHMVINDQKYGTLSGHVIEATCHITMEIFLSRLGGLKIGRVKEPPRPATFIRAT